jgi:predicted acetyltransferase
MGEVGSSTEAQLVRPSVRYRHSVLAAVREFQAEGGYRAYSLVSLTNDFQAFVQHLLDNEDPGKVPTQFVTQTNYWLVKGDEFIGRTSLRHELNEQLRLIGGHIGYEIRPSRRQQGYGTAILGLVLPKARQRGLTRVLITCDADNIASRRIIEHHGGVPEAPYNPADGNVSVLRYWIDLSNVACGETAKRGIRCARKATRSFTPCACATPRLMVRKSSTTPIT